MNVNTRHILFFLGIVFLFSACSNASKPGPEVQDGKALADVYCKSCHKLPEPGQLTKALWKDHVLPQMGYFLGFYPSSEFRKSLLEPNAGGVLVEQAGVYPEQPIMAQADWEKIQAYFIEQAPEAFAFNNAPIAKTNRVFQTIIPPNRFSPPSTTLIRFNPAGGFYLGDAHTSQFLQLNQDFSIKIAAELEEGAVWTEEDDKHLWVTVMGSFSPTDNPSGLLVKLPKQGSSGAALELDNLQRPVHSVRADLDADGIQDIVVCEFGKFTGGLNWYRGSASGKYSKQVLWNKPGAVRTYIEDMNRDGRPDIVALFAQADEGIDVYFNQGKGVFERARVLSFPPGYGSCAFHLIDYNGDGYKDIIYVSGDNADFNPVPRPYHGIYVFLNDGGNQFKQHYFYHLNGAYDALLNDFDLDGDMDIAAISFFPDWKNRPEEGFVFLENTGDMKMKAHSFDGVAKGRWILMDMADYDHGGDQDLVLGSLVMEVKPAMGIEAGWIKDGIPFVILENRTR